MNTLSAAGIVYAMGFCPATLRAVFGTTGVSSGGSSQGSMSQGGELQPARLKASASLDPHNVRQTAGPAYAMPTSTRLSAWMNQPRDFPNIRACLVSRVWALRLAA